MRRWHKLLFTAALAVAGSGAANAYYHYIHYNTTTGPWTPVYEKFDLAALPNKTVSYFITDPAAASVELAPADTVAGLISQIRAGARVWNDVATSDLRIAFGGIVPPDTHQPLPSIEIVFGDDVPPGVVAYGGPQVTDTANANAVPILRSHVVLNRDLTKLPSFGEDFFGTLVHEFGHALGLQHTLTSATMSTGITRATTKGKPLAADDRAGLSVLYPSAGFAATTGSISGRVTVNGEAAPLASVVAITQNGGPVSALSAPDGTYRIDGIAPGQYLVYVHPLPPPLTTMNEITAANITYPVDGANQPLGPGPLFGTQFYPGVRDPVQAYPVTVNAGSVSEGIDFAPAARDAVQLHSVQTYGFPAQVAVKPPYMGTWNARQFIVAGGAGLMRDGSPLGGLSVSILGGAQLPVMTYPSSSAYAQINVDTRVFAFQPDGPRHLLFATPDDLYILPSGLVHAASGPPGITSVDPADGSNGTEAAITGTNLSDRTRILFDGVAGQNRGLDDAGRLMVTPPPAHAGHTANVVALNPDGQSSLFLSAEAPVWTYAGDANAAASFTLTPSALPAGVDSYVTIDATGMSFIDGYAHVAFGTADVQVRRVWVVSASQLLVSVSVARTAGPNTTPVTVISGLQSVTQAAAFATQEFNPALPALSAVLVNTATGAAAAYPGAAVLANVSVPALTAGATDVSVTLNDRPLPVTVPSDGVISFEIPGDMAVGPAVLRLRVGDAASLPLLVAIDPAPPQITAASVNGDSSARVVHTGDYIVLTVAALGDAGTDVPVSRVRVQFGNAPELTPASITTVEGGHQVAFLAPLVTAGSVNVTVSIDRRVSAPLQMTAE